MAIGQVGQESRLPAGGASGGERRAAEEPELRPGSGRIRRLTQAALNVDVTLDRVGSVAEELGMSLHDFQQVLAKMDGMLERFGGSLADFALSIEQIDAIISPVTSASEEVDLADLLARVERIVHTVEWALGPVTWLRRVTAHAASATGRAVDTVAGRHWH